MTDLLQDDPQAVVLALDECHLWFQPTLTRAWSPIGQTPVVLGHPDRDWVAVYGALNLRTGQEHAVLTEKFNQRTTATFLEYLLALYPKRRLLILCDRASWHTGKPVAALLAEHPQLELLAFPVACPELNPQEHVWAAVRQKVSHNHTCRSFAQLAAAFLLTLRRTWVRPTLYDRFAPPILSSLAV